MCLSGGGNRFGLNISDKTSAEDTKFVGSETTRLLLAWFRSCIYTTLATDESTGVRYVSSPMFVVLCGVSSVGWDWRMSFIGQADASSTSDGADIYELVKGIVNGFDTSRRLFPSLKKCLHLMVGRHCAQHTTIVVLLHAGARAPVLLHLCGVLVISYLHYIACHTRVTSHLGSC